VTASRTPVRALWISLASAVSFAVGYSTFRSGGGDAPDWALALLILGLVGLISAAAWSPEPSPQLGRVALWCALLFPAYVAFQLVPLPLVLLRILDPTRAEITNALAKLMPSVSSAPLSVVPPRTWMHLSRIVGYALVFLLVRGLAHKTTEHQWAITVPLLVIGGLEAAVGLAQHGSGALATSGTYGNKDQFAGLLESVLPFTVMYGVAILYRGERRGTFTAGSVIQASCFFALAVAMLAAVTLSLSKMGFISTLGALFVLGVLGWGSRLPGRKKWAAAAGIAVLVLLVFVFLPTNELVQALGGAAGDPTGEGRWPIAKNTLRMIAAYPLFGTGLGTYFPALLRYQTYGLNATWVNAHNDYLELLSELGIIGFLIPAALICAVSMRALRAALLGTTRETRFLGVACAGALASVLIHSFGDFNLYVPANAMVLAWVAGISISLPDSHRREHPERPLGTPRSFRGSVFSLGCLASLYAGAWVVFLHSYQNDFQAERVFCRFGICNTNGALEALRTQYGDGAAIPPGELLQLLPRDPAGPYNWEDLGDSLQQAGRTAEARSCFRRALQLGPRIPYMQFRAALFHFNLGEIRDALDLMVRSLEGDPSRNDAVFEEYDRRKLPVEEILSHGLPPDADLWRSYLSSQMELGRTMDAITVWNALVSRGYANEETANRLAGFLLGKKQHEAAVQAWARFAGSRSPGYPKPEHVFNGDFESDPLPQPQLDWWIDKVPGVAAGFDREAHHSGARSLRIQFDGTQNLTNAGVHQTVVLKPGTYRFGAWVRAKGLSTEEGVAFNVASAEGPGPNFTTESVLGTTDWKLVEHVFQAPAGTGLVRISLVRKAAWKFDNMIKGTLWIDQVSISPASTGKESHDK
jgi:O-antigen ligase